MKNKVAKKNNLLLFLILLPPLLQAQLYFNQLDSLFAYADRSSASAKISAQQSLLAKWTKVAAYANSINFKNPVSFSATNNLLLPVNFIPSEAFGGAQGSFREITLGQQYVSNFNFNPQIDIINPQNWAKIKSAELNQEMTELSNNMAKKSLHESIAAAYFNCLALEEQVDTAEKNLSMADSIRLIVKNKFELGIAREQDLNNATVNMLNVQDKVQQLQAVHQQQVNNLKILCDIPSNMMVTLKDEGATNTEQKIKTGATLESKFSLLQSRFQNSEWKATRLSMLPTLSLVYSNSWQHNSNAAFFDGGAKWIQSRYIGLKLTVPFPPEVSKLSQSYTTKVNYRISILNAAHSQLQNELGDKNLEVEEVKTRTSLDISRQIVELKTSNYAKNLNQYKEGILPTENLLTAFNDLLNSQLAMATARAASNYARARLTIHNSFQ